MPPTHYAPAVIAVQKSSIAISAVEATLLEITDARYLEKSQISMFMSLGTLAGGATQIKLRYYFSFDGGSTYYEMPVMNLGTGDIVDLPDLWKSTSPALFVRDIPASGANAFKVTAQTDAGTASMTKGTIMVRDN